MFIYKNPWFFCNQNPICLYTEDCESHIGKVRIGKSWKPWDFVHEKNRGFPVLDVPVLPITLKHSFHRPKFFKAQ